MDNQESLSEEVESENFILVLSKSPEWIKFCKIIQGHIDTRKKSLGQYIVTEQDKAIHNGQIGEVNGMFFVINYPNLVRDKIAINEKFKELQEKNKEG